LDGDELSGDAVSAKVLMALPDLVLVIDARGRVTKVAGHPETHLGWGLDDVSDATVFDLFVKQGNRPLHEAAFAEILGSQGPHGPIAVSTYGRDGQVHELELRITNLLDDPDVAGIVVIARDITRRVDDVEVARRRDAWSQALLNRTSDVTFVVDANGTLTFVGAASGLALGSPPEAFPATTFAGLLAAGEVERLGGDVVATLTQAVDGPAVTVLARHADGRDRRLQLQVSRISSAGHRSTLVVSATDVSDDRLAEDLLAETAHLLESVARGAPLERTLDEITVLVENRIPGARCVAGVRDESGRLRYDGRGMDAEIIEALDLFGPAARPERATFSAPVADLVANDPEAAEIVRELNLRSCWINAVVGGRADLVVGSLVVLHADQRDPMLGELGLLERYGNVVAIAVERAELSHRLEFRASHDELTGLPNRRELLAQIADRARRRPDDPITLLFADLDRFKLINDSLGHSAGDLLLREVGERFRRSLPPADTVARLGGDEFVVLCEEACSEEDALELAGRLRMALDEPYRVSGAMVVVTASVGVTVTGAGVDPESPLSDADLAMYAAKQRGRNRTAVFHGTMRAQAQERLGLEGALRDALVNDELETWYQPQVSVATGRVIGVEALVRWIRPGHGTIEPGSFIPVAEDSGLIVPLGRWVLDEALADASAWSLEGIDLVVTVNLSARELADPTLVEVVAAALERHGVPPESLCLEVTESDLVADADGSAAALMRLKELGVRLAIDDFGTGYATLDYVRRFAMADVLKIDRSFIDTLDVEGSKDRAIVSAVIVLGQALGFSVVAEGVETASQLQVLSDLGCDAAQGWWFARPVPAARVAETLRLIESLAAAPPASSARSSQPHRAR